MIHTYSLSRINTVGQSDDGVTPRAYALSQTDHFVPFAVETSGALGQAAPSLVWDLGHRRCQATGEERSKECLLQRITIAVQRENAVAVLGPQGGRRG